MISQPAAAHLEAPWLARPGPLDLKGQSEAIMVYTLATAA